MAPKPTSKRDVVIESLAPGGDGVAHLEIGSERRAVFVAHAAPGDVLRVEVDASTRPARGRVLELVSAGQDCVPPACSWASRCGGCDWMHLSLDAQAKVDADHVRAALPAAWRHLTVEVHSASASAGYRSRTRVHARADKRGRIAVGMHEAKSHAPVEVDRCVVLDPALEPARARLGALLEGSTGRGDVRLALGARRLPVLDVEWNGELAPPVFGRIERAVDEGTLAGAQIRLQGANRPARIGDPTPWMTGADGEPLQLAPGGFAQPSETGGAELARYVADLAAAQGAESGVELYAGAGNLTVLLAGVVPGLVAVESDEACGGGPRQPGSARLDGARRPRRRRALRMAPRGQDSRPRSAPHRRSPRRRAPGGGSTPAADRRVRVVRSADAWARPRAPRLGIRGDLGAHLRALPADEPRRDRGRAGETRVKTPVDRHLRAEAQRFAFRFACDDCAHFAPAPSRRPSVPAGVCSLGFAAKPRRDALDGDEVELCKTFELG